MSTNNRRSVRQSYPLYIVGADCSVSAAYQAESSLELEQIVIKFDGEPFHGGSLAVKMDPDMALRLYGAIGSELKMRDEHLEVRRRREEQREQDSAEQCKTVGAGRS